jgi:DNA segregation ATPase FtsK/SpoIIIE, S-DNA-T family
VRIIAVERYNDCMELKGEIELLRQQIEELAESVKKIAERQNSQYTDIMLPLKRIEERLTMSEVEPVDEEELYEDAKELVIEYQRASTSLLQRMLGIGYARAARLIDLLEEKGVIGPTKGAKPREILGKEENAEQ